MDTQNKIFISVKYNYDHIMERSLSAYLKKMGYITYHHQGTIDILKKGALPPILLDGPITIISPSMTSAKRQVGPLQITPEIIRYLTEQVCSHDIVVILWSRPYSESFWTMLEMKAAIFSNKPILIIQTDNHSLCRDLSAGIKDGLYEVADINAKYMTSQAFALIKNMTSKSSPKPESEEIVFQKLQKFVSNNYRGSRGRVPPMNPIKLMYYRTIVSQLRSSEDTGQLHNQIEKLDKKHMLTNGLRKYLEFVISGEIEADWEDWYYTYLLGEILDVRFIHPTMPTKLQAYYETKIKQALYPPQQNKVEELFDEMIGECLFTREFIEYFGFYLRDIAKSHSPLIANIYWEICTSHASDAI